MDKKWRFIGDVTGPQSFDATNAKTTHGRRIAEELSAAGFKVDNLRLEAENGETVDLYGQPYTEKPR